MKKRTLSLLLALVMCLSLLPMTAFAAELPATIEAPSNVFISDIASQGKETKLQFSLTKGTDLQLMIESGAKEYGLDLLWCYVQVDWSLDNKNDWKYQSGWDTMEKREGNPAWEYVNNWNLDAQATVTKTFFDLPWSTDGRWTAWSEVLPASSYTMFEANNGLLWPTIDWTQHTIYVRCRFVVQYRGTGGSDKFIISDWSPVAGYGKDYKPFEKPTSLEAPVISDLELTLQPFGDDPQGDPVVEFKLKNPDSIKEISAGAPSIGHSLRMVCEVSIGGGAWKSLQTDINVFDGTYSGSLRSAQSEISEDTWVQCRTRYEYWGEHGEIIPSAWSNVIEFGAPAWGNASDWATEELARADELGLIPDCLEGEDLTQDITRAEFAAVAVKVYEALSGTAAIPIVNNPFTDTSDVEVLKAYNIGAVNGTSATTYDPDALLNREQAATMLTRVFKKITLAGWTLATDSQFTLPYTKPAAFADDKDISDWAKDSVYFMAANGIINGVGNNKFAPKNVTTEEQATGYANATREQALLIAVRMVENLGS